MKYIAVLLTVYNRKDKTLKCLHNLFNQKLPDGFTLDVYLTDDGCTDGTPEAVKAQFTQVKIIEGDGSLFWNRGMYAAWSEAEKGNYDYYLWLNDDTFILEKCLLNLIDTAMTNEGAIIVGSTIDSAQSKITYGGWSNRGIIRDLTSKARCITFNGNIVLIPKTVFSILGKNDYYFRHSLGDLDYGLRATKHGIPIVICPTICGICDTHDSIPKWKDSKVSLIKRLKYLYSTGGNGSNPREQFYFRKRHYGYLCAVKIYLTSHIHCIFPCKLFSKK